MPELMMRVAVLGLLSLKTRPGNCLGLYSTFLNTFMMSSRLIFWSRLAEATTFTMLMSRSSGSSVGSWVIFYYSVCGSKHRFLADNED